MAQFSTNEAVSLEKRVNCETSPALKSPEQIKDEYEIDKCVEWIKSNDFQKVCLQFPDYLLPHAGEVATQIKRGIKRNVYIMGDTAYESCCIDYVTAAHINANAIIHFGPVCFSKPLETVPYLNIYEKCPLDVKHLMECIQNLKRDERILILLDAPYVHKLDEVATCLAKRPKMTITPVTDTPEIHKGEILLFIGKSERKLLNINFKHSDVSHFWYNPEAPDKGIVGFEMDSKILKRRYFLREKVKDANTFGIIIGTVAVRNYLNVIERVKSLIRLHNRKYYVISVGKPTVAKLANFPEVDIYVVISCAMNDIYESREFYKPIVTPYDLETALNPTTGELKFSYDYNSYCDELATIENIQISPEADVSLITGKTRWNPIKIPNDEDGGGDQGTISVRTSGTVAVNSAFGAGYLAERSWRGLEQDLGRTEVKIAKEGRTGIPQGYDNEKECS